MLIESMSPVCFCLVFLRSRESMASRILSECTILGLIAGNMISSPGEWSVSVLDAALVLVR